MGASAGNFLNTRSNDSLNTDCRTQGGEGVRGKEEDVCARFIEAGLLPGMGGGEGGLYGVWEEKEVVVVCTCPKESASTMRPPVFSTHTFISIMPTYITHTETHKRALARKTGAKHNSPLLQMPQSDRTTRA
jgi:hypothetical protein